MQISGSVRLSGAARATASFAPTFEFGRYPPMTPDSGGTAINYGADGAGGIVVNGTTISMTRGYDARISLGKDSTNKVIYSLTGGGPGYPKWTESAAPGGSWQSTSVDDDPLGHPAQHEDQDPGAEPVEGAWCLTYDDTTFPAVDDNVYEVIQRIKSGSFSWFYVGVTISNGFVYAEGSIYFNASTGTIGEKSVGVSGESITSLGDGYYEVRYFITVSGSEVNAQLQFLLAAVYEDGGTWTFSALGDDFTHSLSQVALGNYAHVGVYTNGSEETVSGTVIPDSVSSDNNMYLVAGTPTGDIGGPGPGAVGVKSDATAYFQADTGPAIGTLDGIVAVAMQWKYSASKQVFLSTSSPAGTGDGIEVYTDAGEYTIKMDIEQGATTVTAVSPAIVSGEDVFFVGAVNRGEDSTSGFYAFANSTAGSGVNPSGVSASITDSAPLTLFSDGDGGNIYSGGPIYGAWVWEAADIFSAGATGAAEMQAVASELTQRFFGLYPQLAESGDYTMTITQATATTAEVSRAGVSTIFYIAPGAIAEDDSGVLIEGAATNLCLQSKTFATTWSKLDAGDTITNNNAAGPDGQTSASTLVADATDGDHGVSQAIDLTATGYVFSVYAKAGDKTWLYLSDDTVANCTCYFDLSTSAVGTAGAGATGGIRSIGGDWSRCWVTFTGTVATHTFRIQSADADNDKTVTGDGVTKNTYLYGAQVETGSVPSSYVVTTTAAVTRNASVVDADADNIPTTVGTIITEFKVPDHTPPTALPIFQISDGTANHSIKAYVHTDGTVIAETRESGGDSGDVTVSGDFADGAWHRLCMTWKSGQLTARVDDSSASDTSCTVPTATTTFSLGRDISGSYLNGRLRNFVVYEAFVEQIDDAWGGGGWGGALWF